MMPNLFNPAPTFYLLPARPSALKIPMAIEKIPAGFPSPAEGYACEYLDFNQYLVDTPASTFTVKCGGDSMIDAGISKADLLVIDRALVPKHMDIVMADLGSEYTIKRLHKVPHKKMELRSENSQANFPNFVCDEYCDFRIIGVVIHLIKSFRK